MARILVGWCDNSLTLLIRLPSLPNCISVDGQLILEIKLCVVYRLPHECMGACYHLSNQFSSIKILLPSIIMNIPRRVLCVLSNETNAEKYQKFLKKFVITWKKGQKGHKRSGRCSHVCSRAA